MPCFRKMSAINVVPNKQSGTNDTDSKSNPTKKAVPHPHPEIVADSDSDDSTLPDHHHIYERK